MPAEPHIKVERTGTQYDEDHIVCIDRESQIILDAILREEVRNLEDMVEQWKELDEREKHAKAKRALDVTHELLVEVNHLPICSD